MISPDIAEPRPFVRRFNQVVVRHRNDGWTPAKQVRFIEALAESACVIDACRAVGMSAESAYTLRRRYDAVDFRLSWDAALDYAVQRVSEAAIGRAIHGVAVPHYYKGEIVGEHRRCNQAFTISPCATATVEFSDIGTEISAVPTAPEIAAQPIHARVCLNLF